MSQLIFLGAPGSGKGTQASKLVKLGFSHISTGDLLRAEIKKESNLGKRVKEILAAGSLVDDQTVLDLLNANCDLQNSEYIFDGFPRNVEQAKLLDTEVLKGTSTLAIYFDIDLDMLAERLVNRRTCGDCGEIYNLLYKAPSKNGVCDKCNGSNLVHRKDDTKETVNDRLQVFKDQTFPVLEYYEAKGALKRINASLGAEEVFAELNGFIGK